MSMVTQAPARGCKKISPRSKQDLSVHRSDLLELLQYVNFGRIEGLIICNSEPVLDPLPRVIREIKFGGDNRPRPELHVNNFFLKMQVIELFQFFDQIDNGTIEVLEIKHGLPFNMSIVSDRQPR